MSTSKSARHKYEEERSKQFDPRNLTSRQFFLTTIDQANNFHRQQTDYNHILKKKVERQLLPDEVVSKTSIYEMHLHMMENVVEICDANVHCLLPNGGNLRTWLEIDQESTVSWKQPVVNLSQTDDNHLRNEISVPHFDKKKFESHAMHFNDVVSFTRQSLFNATPLAFSVQYVCIPRSEYRKLVKGADDGRRSGGKVNFSFHHVHDLKDSVKVPTMLTVGCRNHSLIFKFGLSELESDKDDNNVRNFSYEYSTIPDEIIDFFKLLPPLYSVNALFQMNILENTLADLYGIDEDNDVKFRCFDLLGLALANGCRMDVCSRYTLSAICLGEPFPVLIDSFDENWALDLNPIRARYLEDLHRLYHDVYTILMGLLLRNVHPDPHIILRITEMTQSSFVAWFSEFIAASLEDCRFPNRFDSRDTRAEMLARVGNSSKKPFKYLLDLIIDVPVASFGGARFLHHVLHRSSIQYYALSKIRLPHYTGEMPNLNKDIENDTHALRFKREYANDSGEPTKKLGLNASPSCCGSLYNLNLQSIDSFVLPSKDFDLIHRIKEWGRLNVDKLPLLFYKINKLSTDVIAKSWLQRIDLYAYLSNLYFYMKGERITVTSLEQSLMIRKLNVEVNYENSRRKAEKVFMKTEQRIDVLHHQPGKYGVHQKVQAVVPGDFTKDNKAKAGQKKRRLQRFREKKLKAGIPWVPRRELVNERRAEQLSATGFNLGSNGVQPSTSNQAKLANDDLRNKLRKKVSFKGLKV